MTKKSKQNKAKLARVLRAVFAEHGITMRSSREAADALRVKLNRLAQAETDILSLREVLKANDAEIDMLTTKVAVKQALASQMNAMARAMCTRVSDLKTRADSSAAFIATLSSTRDIFVRGGGEAESLRAVLKSVKNAGAPSGYDKPAPTLTVDCLTIMGINENTPPMPADEFDSLRRRMFVPVPESDATRLSPDSMLAEIMAISSLFCERDVDCSACPRADSCLRRLSL
jgi:hypothetical protein